MKKALLLLAFPVLLAGCATGYRGNGNFAELTRTYIPVIGVTRGYSIEMPVFSPQEDVSATYLLEGIPRKNWGFYVDLVVYLPKERLPPKQEEIDVSVPKEHEITCRVVDSRTSKVLMEMTSPVHDLNATQSYAFFGSPFVKQLLTVPFRDLPRRADLKIEVEYRTKGIPLKREMLIVVVNDAPLA